MFKLLIINLMTINLQLWAGAPILTNPAQLDKCLKRELAIHGGKETPCLREQLFSSGCYKWVEGKRVEQQALIKKCLTEYEFAHLLAKKYCEKTTKA